MSTLQDSHLLEQAFLSELQPDELLLWTGRPGQGLLFRSYDVFMIPFSLLWGGFAFFWEFSVLYHLHLAKTQGSSIPQYIDLLFPLFGIPFCIVGLYLIFGRFLQDIYRRRKTGYAITNKRAIIVTGFFGHTVQSYYLDKLDNIRLKVRQDGSGTIRLAEPRSVLIPSWQYEWLIGDRRSLEGIANVREVFGLIQEAREQAQSELSPRHVREGHD
jgi:hypothetical protein